MDTEKYPESSRLLAVSKESQTCGEFLDWLRSKGFVLAEYDPESESGRLYPAHFSTTSLLAEFFGIDINKLEQEKRAVLEEYQQRANA